MFCYLVLAKNKLCKIDIYALNFLTTKSNVGKPTACNLFCYRSSYDLEVLNGSMVLSGTPCNNYKGYCDALLTCRKVL